MSEDTVVEEVEDQEVEDQEVSVHPYDLPGEWFVLNAQSGHEKKKFKQTYLQELRIYISKKKFTKLSFPLMKW